MVDMGYIQPLAQALFSTLLAGECWSRGTQILGAAQISITSETRLRVNVTLFISCRTKITYIKSTTHHPSQATILDKIVEKIL